MSLAHASRATQHARHALLANEQHLTGQVKSAYRVAQASITPHVAAFAARYRAELQRRQHAAHADALDTGSDLDDAQAAARRARVPSTWLSDRTPTGGNLAALRAHVHDNLSAFAADAAHLTTHAQAMTGRQAIQSLRQTLYTALRTTTPPAVRDDDDDEEDDEEALLAAMIGTSAYHGAPLSSLFGHVADGASAALFATALLALAGGYSAERLTGALWQRIGGAFSGAVTICRTELALLWRTISLDGMRQQQPAVTGWIWRAQAGACPFCAAMNGTRHTLDETLDSHPNCRCVPEPIVSTP